MFEDDGRLRRGLVTLPCPLFASNATVRLSRWEPELTVTPRWKTKALDAARSTLQVLGMGDYGGELEMRGDVAVGRGLGSSTSDVTAAILAVLAAAYRNLAPERIARIAVTAEAATDPLIYFDRMLLFAHREGAVIEDFHRPVPPLAVVGFSSADKEIDTLALPRARYNAWEIECFRALRGLMRRAVARGDHRELGRISTASARINQRFLPVPRFDRVLEIAEETEALGVQVAHSGTVAALLFAPHQPGLEQRTALAARRSRSCASPTTGATQPGARHMSRTQTSRRAFTSVVDGHVLPKVIQVGPNVYGAAFHLMKLLPAQFILTSAIETGELTEGTTVVETTSGTFGLGLAMVCLLKGIPWSSSGTRRSSRRCAVG